MSTASVLNTKKQKKSSVYTVNASAYISVCGWKAGYALTSFVGPRYLPRGLQQTRSSIQKAELENMGLLFALL